MLSKLEQSIGDLVSVAGPGSLRSRGLPRSGRPLCVTASRWAQLRRRARRLWARERPAPGGL